LEEWLDPTWKRKINSQEAECLPVHPTQNTSYCRGYSSTK
jgi:hypothetical protein